MNTDEKKIDDKRIENKYSNRKSELENYDNAIDTEKKILSKLDEEQEIVAELHKKMAQCIDYLSLSIKGEKINKRHSEMYDENMLMMKKSFGNIDSRREAAKERIKKLYDSKLEKEKEFREENLKSSDKSKSSNDDDKENKKVENESNK